MISVRYQYDLSTPFVRRLYAVCTLICVHQYDLSTLFVRWFAYISTISVRNVLNLYDVSLKRDGNRVEQRSVTEARSGTECNGAIRT